MKDNIVEKFSNEEMDDFASWVFGTILKCICKFADKHNYDRINILKYTAQTLMVLSEIATIENYGVE